MNVFRFERVLVSWAATPKSASLTSPESVSRMLPHLMSLCTCTDGECLVPWYGQKLNHGV